MPPAPPLVALEGARLGFGGRPLFEDLSLGLARGERACLVGRNGGGKSTLLKVLAGLQELDGGRRFLQPGTRVAYLPQEPVIDPERTVAEEIAGGLPEDDRQGHRVAAVLERFDLDGARRLGSLSGGEGRRCALARALVAEPDVLLLDEPTNHLDLPAIERLEADLLRFAGALLMISHDRAFLTRVSRTTLWLDRGRLRRLDRGFAAFDDWKEELEAREAEARHRLERRIVREQRWLERGVTARRKRNQGRLARVEDLRRRRAEWLKGPGVAKLSLAAAETGGDLVLEAEGLAKSFPVDGGPPQPILRDVSTRVMRGDRIGIIGPNGAGKTTLVRLLMGELEPDAGTLRLGSGLAPLYFDQRRARLDPEASLWRTLVPDGGDSLSVGGRQRHVVAYLRDFLFEESQARQPVKSLSGGERNRLLLARLFAQPSNFLVLDEPTNDLDMETLDLLTEVLEDFQGTLLLVSHDRDFLDRLATGIIALEGDGRARDYVGGYSDYLRQRGARPDAPAKPKPTRPATSAGRAPRGASKLGYKDQRELDRLPSRIDELTETIRALEERLADPAFFAEDPDGFGHAAEALTRSREQLGAAEERWLELEGRREALAAAADAG